MATAREIRRRIRSVKNIAQITKAMQAVSASKVHRAQTTVLASRPFSTLAFALLADIAVQTRLQAGEILHPLLEVREPVERVAALVITSDRGLTGPYNTNMFRTIVRFEERIVRPVQYTVVGRKGRDFLIRRRASVGAEFIHLSDAPSINDIAPMARLVMDEFLSRQVDEVYVAYTDFINMLTQKPVVLRLLPIKPYSKEDMVMAKALEDQLEKRALLRPAAHREYIYEPSARVILDQILPRFVEVLIYQAVLESQASEHAARMVAMRTATENADILVDELTLYYNKARQLAITNEMLDIVGGAEAMGKA
ncbi:MAG: ATP synthase F1 subunit gamma [Anaerolineae bacterium]|nr:ATP synthase F1 subunit gamma [Anaerolineae bacterium]